MSALRAKQVFSSNTNRVLPTIGLSTGFFVVNSSIPSWLRWIKYLAYPNLCYSILASNEFTDIRFTCPYFEQTGVWDPAQCGKYDGNTILVYQLDLRINDYPRTCPFSFQISFYFVITCKRFVFLIHNRFNRNNSPN